MAREVGLGSRWAIALIGITLGGCADSQGAIDAGTDGGAGTTSASADDDASDDAAADGSDDGAASGIPCEVQQALAEHCNGCHGDPVQFGATMPLASHADFLVPAVTDPTVSVAELVQLRIADPDRPMPADASMSPEDAATITQWIATGTPADLSGADCDLGDDDDPPWGPEALPCKPDVFFTASAADGESAFAVPIVDDLNECFVFDSPFGADTQAIAWAPVIDDARVVHHWLLLEAPADTPLGPAQCVGTGGGALDAPMLMGWGPGTMNYVMPDEAGLELPDPGSKLMLQIHYNNSAGHSDVQDRSGVALCTTEEPRPHAAGTLWLGSVQIDVGPGEQQTVTSDCETSELDEPVHVLLEWPHMHEIGTSIRTEVLRAGSNAVDPLATVDAWNFENQAYYAHDPAVLVEPGDVLRTTCVYDNDTTQTVGWGETTGDEMCFDFATVYPITAFDVPNQAGPRTDGRYCFAR